MTVDQTLSIQACVILLAVIILYSLAKYNGIL